MEAEASQTQERIDRLVDDLEKTPAGPAKEAVQRRLAQRNTELVQLRQQILEMRLTVRASNEADGDIDARFVEARSKMNSDDPEERRNARREVAAQFQRVIEQISLHEDRTLTIQMKPRDGIGAAYRLSQEGLIRAEISTQNGHVIGIGSDGRWWIDDGPAIKRVIELSAKEFAQEWTRMSDRERARPASAFETRIDEIRRKHRMREYQPSIEAVFEAFRKRFGFRIEDPEKLQMPRAYLRQISAEP
jgi:hypothetical protein